jgi:hypothetical protein
MSRTTHPAIIQTQSFYYEPRDLLPHEEALLTAVHFAGRSRSADLRCAIQLFGDGSRAYEATRFLADRAHDHHLDVALEAYCAEHERIDQGEDELRLIDYHMAMEAAE